MCRSKKKKSSKSSLLPSATIPPFPLSTSSTFEVLHLGTGDRASDIIFQADDDDDFQCGGEKVNVCAAHPDRGWNRISRKSKEAAHAYGATQRTYTAQQCYEYVRGE